MSTRRCPSVSIIAVYLFSALMVWSSLAFAQTNLHDDVNAIIRSLAPTLTPPDAGNPAPSGGAESDAANEALTTPIPGTPVQVVTPTIVIQRPVEIVIHGEAIIIDADRAVDFEVYFPYDSAELTSQAIQTLQALGRALASPELRPYSYLVAGHTDASGPAEYNRDLSARRADAVRDFLIRQFAIDPARLLSIGFGEDRLRSPEEPLAAINRRVEIALIARRPDEIK